MAIITKASIKSSKTASGKRSCFVFAGIFLTLMAILNLFKSESGGVPLQDVGKSEASVIAQAKVGSSDVTMDTLVANNNENNNNIDPFYPKDVNGRKVAYIFHHTPNDRAGKEAHVIMDMLQGHAYAFHEKQIYGGSCASGNDLTRGPERSLLKAIGLDHILLFACPGDIKSNMRQKEIPSKSYQQYGARSLTPEYVDLLKSVTKYPERKDDEYTIVVHIRRGKITPCRKPFNKYDPYLPNRHYQILIDKYMKPNAKVVIYSQEPSHESLDEFREKGYTVHVNEDIADVWSAAMLADVFVMSRSDFSFVPAILTKAMVVYTPFWEKPQRGWHIVGKDVLDQSTGELERLKSACPQSSHLSRLRQRLGKG